MPGSKRLLLAIFAVALLMGLSPAFAGGAPAPSGGVQAALASAGCPQTVDLTPALSCPAATTALPGAIPEPEFLANKKLGYCHCGCGPATCRTSADCGGASCDTAPSCC